MKIVDAVLRRLRPHVTKSPAATSHLENEPLQLAPHSVVTGGHRTYEVWEQAPPPPGTAVSFPEKRLLSQEVILRSGTRLVSDLQAQTVTITPAGGQPTVYPSTSLTIGKNEVSIVNPKLTQSISPDGTLALSFPHGTRPMYVKVSPAGHVSMLPYLDDAVCPFPTGYVETAAGSVRVDGVEVTPYVTRRQVLGTGA